MKGSCVNADLETMLQLTWLYFTRPRRDEAAFKSIINRQRLFLANRDANPMVAYRDSITAILYGNNPRLAPITKESLNKVNLDRIMQIYRERFADASDFDVVFTGNVNIDSLRPLLCTYLASLPANHSSEQARDNGVRIRPVKETHVMVKKQEVPSSVTSIYLSAPFSYNVDNDLRLDVLGQLLRILPLVALQQQLGGVIGLRLFSPPLAAEQHIQPSAVTVLAGFGAQACHAPLHPGDALQFLYRSLRGRRVLFRVL